jgi:hypothetical protein
MIYIAGIGLPPLMWLTFALIAVPMGMSLLNWLGMLTVTKELDRVYTLFTVLAVGVFVLSIFAGSDAPTHSIRGGW